MNKILYFIVLFQCGLYAQNAGKACAKIKRIHSLVKVNHYKMKPIDDSLSANVYDAFFEILDQDKNFFTIAEEKKLSRHKFKIDNYIAAKDCSFLDEIALTYKNALQRNLAMIEALEKQNIVYNTKDTLFFISKNRQYIKNEERMKNFIRKSVTYDILIDIAEQSKNKDSLVNNFDKIAETSKTKIFENKKCILNSLIKDDSSFYDSFYDSFLLAYSSYFDPHTSYFNYSEKESFMSTVTASSSSVGINFEFDDNENLLVAEIIPGSPAFEYGKIDSGDQLLKIKHDKDDFAISCATIDKVSELISSDNYTILEFTFRKKTGDIFNAKLEKKIMKTEENLAYSFIVENKAKVGYIKIPSFYSDEEGSNNLSNDVAREIIKLQEDKVDGIIIDLDNNGGGSITEAIKMVGMFIDIGPVALVHDKYNNIETLKDFNRGVVYSGPIVVIVNGFSASASEFFANAIQDYNRGIIIGNETYGKASTQSIIPFEDSYENKDFIKITGQKFYRITGKSHQNTGLIPDVKLPLLFENFMPKESQYKQVLANDSIVPKLSFKKHTNNFEPIIQKSKHRVLESAYFKEIESLNGKLETFIKAERKPLLLTFNTVFDEVHRSNDLYTETKKINDKMFGFLIKNTSIEAEKIKFDSYFKTNNAEKMKELQKNARVFEAITIIYDLTH